MTPVKILGEHQGTGLTVSNGASGELRRLDLDGVYVEVGLQPHTDFVRNLMEAIEIGEIKVDGMVVPGSRVASRPETPLTRPTSGSSWLQARGRGLSIGRQ